MPFNLHKRLREAIVARGMTPAELARQVGVSNGYVSKLLSGDINQPKKNLSAICKALSIRESWLLSGIGDANLEYFSAEKNLRVYQIDNHGNLEYLFDLNIQNVKTSSKSDICVIRVTQNELMDDAYFVIDKKGIGTGIFLIFSKSKIIISSRFDLLNKVVWIHNSIQPPEENNFLVIGKILQFYSIDGEKDEEDR